MYKYILSIIGKIMITKKKKDFIKDKCVIDIVVFSFNSLFILKVFFLF